MGGEGRRGTEREVTRGEAESRADRDADKIVKGLLSSTGMWFVILITLHNSNIHTVTCTHTYSMSYYHFDSSQPD